MAAAPKMNAYLATSQMLSAWLITLAVAEFVPYLVTDTLAHTPVDAETLKYALGNHSTVVLMVAKSRDSKILTTFVQMQALYTNAHFVTAIPAHMHGFFNDSTPKTPYITIFRNSEPEITFGPIFDAETTLLVTDLWLTKQRRALPDQTALIGAMNGGPRTIAVAESAFELGLAHAKATSVSHGPANVVIMSPSLMKELKLQPNDCCVYRRDDQVLETLKHCRLNDYKSHLRPAYSHSNRWTWRSPGLIVAFRTKSKAIPSVNSIMGQLGDYYKKLTFVIAEGEFASRVANVINDSNYTETETNVALVNFEKRYYLDLGDTFSEEMKTGEFDPGRWGNEMAMALNPQRLKALPKIYFSGTETNITNTTYQRACGKNYHKFMESDRDVLMLLVKPRSRECSLMYRAFRKLAEELDEANNSDFYFVLYDVVANGIPGGNPGPKAVCPTVLFYPVSDRKNPRVVPVDTFDGIKWMLSRYASHPPNLTFTMPDANDVARVEERQGVLDKHSKRLAESFKRELEVLRAEIAAQNETMSTEL